MDAAQVVIDDAPDEVEQAPTQQQPTNQITRVPRAVPALPRARPPLPRCATNRVRTTSASRPVPPAFLSVPRLAKTADDHARSRAERFNRRRIGFGMDFAIRAYNQ